MVPRLPGFPQFLVIVLDLIPQLAIFSPQVGDLSIEPINLSFAVLLLLNHFLLELSYLLPKRLNLVFVTLARVVRKCHILLSLLKLPLLSPHFVHLLFP